MKITNGPFPSILLAAFLLAPLISGYAPLLHDGEGREHRSTTGGPVSFTICDWRWNRTGAVSLTFDDGLSSHVKLAAPILTARGLPGTFFVTIGNVGIPYGGNWSDWQNISDRGHEIGCHTITHPDLTTCSPSKLFDEVVLSKRIIEENITDMRCESFNYPMGRYNSTVLDLVSRTYIAARGDDHNITSPPAPNPKTPENRYSVIPVNFGGSETAEEMSDLLNDTLDTGGWLVEMIHAVEGGGWDSVPLSEFRPHMDRISSMKDELWVDTFANISKYIRERDGARLTCDTFEDHIDNISLDSGLDPEIYDVPLTLDVRVPPDWVDVDVVVDDHRVTISPPINGSERHIFMEMPIGSGAAVYKNVSFPSLVPRDQGDVFSPGNGNSSTMFHFEIVFGSGRGRNVSHGPDLFLDLNGDGDADDVFRGMTEGPHRMERVNLTGGTGNGSLFGVDLSFPPGCRDIGFFIEARDTENLPARYPAEGFMRGPEVNDPPGAPSGLSVMFAHSRHPRISWDPPDDPDGDDVSVLFRLGSADDGLLLVNRSLVNETSLELSISDEGEGLEPGLWFNRNLSLELRFMDSKGAFSSVSELRFHPVNGAPSPVSGMFVIGRDTSGPILHFNPSSDPEGDEIIYHITLLEGAGDSFTPLPGFPAAVSDTFFLLPGVLMDNRTYRVEIVSEDEYHALSGVSSFDFLVDLPPFPVRNISVTGEGDALVEWEYDELFARNISGFELLVFDGDPAVSGVDPVMRMMYGVDSRNASVPGLEHGRPYWFSVVPYDFSGNRGEPAAFVRFTPRDVVPPGRVTNLTAEIEGNPPVCRLRWEMEFTGDLQGFMIFRMENGTLADVSGIEPLHVINEGNNSPMEWLDEGISNDTVFNYAVVPFDGNGNRITTELQWVRVNVTSKKPLELPDEGPGGGSNFTISDEDEGGIPGHLILLVVLIAVLLSLAAVFVLERRGSSGSFEE